MKKRNTVLIIASIIFGIIALTFLILGFALSGADILGWFTSKWAYLFYTAAGLHVLVLIVVLSKDWINRL